MSKKQELYTTNDLVSIVIPVYNVRDYVERCINSVVSQSYENLECIIVDDCGSDDSIDRCKSIVDNYSGNKIWEIISHTENRGLSEARNTGIKNANGRWIYFLDSDDYLTTGAIEQLVGTAKAHSNAQMVIGGIHCPQFPERYCYPFCESTNYIEGSGVGEFLLFNSHIPVNAWNKLIMRSFILDHNLYFIPQLIHEDEMWSYDASRYLTAVAFTQSPTYVHVVTEKSIMTTATLERTQKNWNIIINRILSDKPARYVDRAMLKYLGVFLTYYKRTIHSDDSDLIYKRFMVELNTAANKKLIKLLRLYSKSMPMGARSVLRRLLYFLISSKQGL